jgi:hypothetical protein
MKQVVRRICLAYSSVLKMETPYASAIFIDFQRTIWRYNYRCEEVKCYMQMEDWELVTTDGLSKRGNEDIQCQCAMSCGRTHVRSAI